MNFINALKVQTLNLPYGGSGIGITGPTHISGLGQAVSDLLPFAFSLVGLVAFVYLLFGSFKYLTSGGDEKAIDSAKHTITAALIGLVITFLAYSIIKVLEGTFNIRIFNTLIPAAYAQVDIGQTFANGVFQSNPKLTTLGGVISSLLPTIFAAAGIAFFIYFIYGSFSLMASGGDEKAKAAAKKKITTALIGLLLVFLSFWIIRIFGTILRIPFIAGQ